LLLILDSNEYIFALASSGNKTSQKLLEKVAESPKNISLRVPRLIIEEVRDNLTLEAFKEFLLLINGLTKIDDDMEVPFALGAKYENMGMKPADAFIAAYAEWTGADALVTENRHFLSRQTNLPFKVINAANCLKLLDK
jgi:predicted nucleic acid-binding protein